MDETPDGKASETAWSDAAAGFEAADLARITSGQLIVSGSGRGRGGAVDSRGVEAGAIFFALPGERTDGHHFLEAAVAAGAAALVVTERPSTERLAGLGSGGHVSIVLVADAASALRAAAGAWRDRFEPVVVGITGSIAKTSTKEQTATLLSERYRVLRNRGNENNEIGLPLTLLRLRPQDEIAVLEMGLYTPGEIALLARLARPAIGVVTAVRGVHLSRAGSIGAIEAGKRELVEALPAHGWAVLNADDPRVLGMAEGTPATVITYGFAPEADVSAEDVHSLGVSGMRFRLRSPLGSHDVHTPALGRHGVHNALAAAAVAICVGLPADDIVAGLGHALDMPHRSQLRRAGPWTILDDSYNASPDAVLAALDLLGSLPGRHIAVLGEMLELGDAASQEHQRVGAAAATMADRLVVVGDGAREVAEGALAAGLEHDHLDVVADRDAALEALLRTLRDGDTILVKASRGAALDLLVDGLVLAGGAGEASA